MRASAARAPLAFGVRCREEIVASLSGCCEKFRHRLSPLACRSWRKPLCCIVVTLRPQWPGSFLPMAR